MLLTRTERFRKFSGDFFGNAQNVVALIFSFQRGAANTVDGFALLVHYIVVFEEMFASVEVLRFHGLLGIFNTAGDQAGLDGHAFGHSEAEHQGFDALAAENAHQVVFERKKESRGTGIALASGASAQLIIDAASFVAFRAENVQAAEFNNLVVFGFTLRGKFLEDGLPL